MTTILPRDMYDAVPSLVGNIPTDAFAVAGYVDSISFTWPQSAWDRFPHSIHVTITTTGRVRAHWADCENGDLTVQQAYDLYQTGGCLGIYCNFATWQSVQDVFNANRRPQCPYLIAQYPGGGRVLPVLNGVQAVAHQYQSTPGYDLSCITDTFLSIIGVSTVELTDSIPTSYGSTTIGQLFSDLAECMPGVGGKHPQGGTWAFLQGQQSALLSAVAQTDTDVKTESAALSADETALLAAIKAQPTGGQVDVTTLAAALVPLLVAQLPPDATLAQIGATLTAAIDAEITKHIH